MQLAESCRRRCNLFTLWEYPNGAPEYVRVNIESWRRHAHGRCLGTQKHSEKSKFFACQTMSNLSASQRFALILPELGREYFIVWLVWRIMAYYQDLVEIRRCVPSVCFPWVCVCACVNVNDRCARCRAHFSQWEEHQAIYTRSSGGALSWLCANFEISCWWKVYEHNTEIIGDSHVRNTSRFHTKPRDPMLCPGGPGGPGAAEVFLRRLVWSGLSWLVAVVHMGHMSLDVPRSAMQWSITMVASTWTQTSWY